VASEAAGFLVRVLIFVYGLDATLWQGCTHLESAVVFAVVLQQHAERGAARAGRD